MTKTSQENQETCKNQDKSIKLAIIKNLKQLKKSAVAKYQSNKTCNKQNSKQKLACDVHSRTISRRGTPGGREPTL